MRAPCARGHSDGSVRRDGRRGREDCRPRCEESRSCACSKWKTTAKVGGGRRRTAPTSGGSPVYVSQATPSRPPALQFAFGFDGLAKSNGKLLLCAYLLLSTFARLDHTSSALTLEPKSSMSSTSCLTSFLISTWTPFSVA